MELGAEPTFMVDTMTNPGLIADVLKGYRGKSAFSEVAEVLREFDRQGGMLYVRFGLGGSEIEYERLEDLAKDMIDPNISILAMRLEQCGRYQPIDL